MKLIQMETGQKTTRKINKTDSFSIINLTINIGYNEIGFILYDNIENTLLDSIEINYKQNKPKVQTLCMSTKQITILIIRLVINE